MNWAPIAKSPQNWGTPPNLLDYAQARAEFSWDAIRQELAGLPGDGLNIARVAVDRHGRLLRQPRRHPLHRPTRAARRPPRE